MGNAAIQLAVREITGDGVDLVVEVAPAVTTGLDLAVIRPRGTVAVYANNGGDTVTLDVRQTFSHNVRFQFVLLSTVGQAALDAAAEDVVRAVDEGAFGVGDAHGLPLHHFPLERAADAHQGCRGRCHREGADRRRRVAVSHHHRPPARPVGVTDAGRRGSVTTAGRTCGRWW